MDNATDCERDFLQKFLENSSRVLESGYAYVFAHPNLIPLMNFKLQKINALQRSQEEHQEALRKAYIEYIAKLTRYGLEHARYNSESLIYVKKLQSIFEQYEELCGNCKECEDKPQPSRQPKTVNIRQQASHQKFSEAQQYEEKIYDKILHEIKELSNKFDALGVRMRESTQNSNQRSKLKPNNRSDEDCSDETLVKFNEYLELKLRNLRKEKKKKQRKQTKHRREKKKIATRRPDSSDCSDNDSSEVLLRFSELEKSKTGTKNCLRNIEHHLVIPVEAEKSPKITPRIYLKKSAVDGSMQLDLKLMFDDEIFYKDNLFRGICIRNSLPVQGKAE